MSISKNFVIKNGIEVRTDLIVGDANTGKVGIATTTPRYTLHVNGGIGATDLYVSGVTTSKTVNVTDTATLGTLVVQGTASALTGIITNIQGTNLNYSGIGTIATLNSTTFSSTNIQATNANVSGITTVNNLIVNGTFDSYSGDATFHGNVTIDGNITIGGTSGIINATELRVEDKDIILGFTTSQLPTDDTANHGGIAVASTEGTPLVSLQAVGINTLPDTYKQIMWVKRNTMGAGTTDAFLFNYGVGIGSTQVPNGTRLAVGAVQITDDAVNARIGNLTNVRGTNINATGITTTNSLSIDATQVISSARQLQNIASLDATTTATIESAIANAPNTFTDLKVTGITTLGTVQISSGIVTASSGIVTYYGDGSKLKGIGVGIQSAGNLIGYGVTTLNFVGAGNTFAYNPTTNTVDVSIAGGGGRSGFATYVAGIATASSVGINTTNLDDPDLTGIGNSFKGLYIGNGMLIVDNQLNGDHYIGTNFNGLMAGPVTINGTLTVDGNYVVV